MSRRKELRMQSPEVGESLAESRNSVAERSELGKQELRSER